MAEVAGVLATCDRARVAVVPQGGNTGLVGGSVPLDGEVLLDLRRLDVLEPVDPVARSVVAAAGVPLAAVQTAATAHGLRYAVDLAARDTATIGGTVATNAGGLAFLRHGGTRQQLLGIEAVRADGTVVRHLAGLAKDNTGYDLGGLLCGSEGTLAVVTAVTLRLVAAPSERATALVGFADLADALGAALDWRDDPTVEALELVSGAGMTLVCEHLGLPALVDEPAAAWVLVEAVADTDPTERLGGLVEASTGIVAAAVATDEARRGALWRYREEQTAVINRLGPPHKLDVTLPAAALESFLVQLEPAVRAEHPDAAVWWFGHVGDGNVHVNVTGVPPEEEGVDEVVLRLVVDHGGSISAEHGIGTAKRRWLHLARSAAELDTFRRIKQALDPNGILNPNVLLPPG